MAGSKTDAFETDVLKAALGFATSILSINTARTPYLALFTVAPSDSTGGTEVTGGSYARVSTVSGVWGTPATGSVTNSVGAVTFPTATANWGTVVAVAIMDASSSGNMLYWADMTSSRTINTGDTLTFPVNNLTITES